MKYSEEFAKRQASLQEVIEAHLPTSKTIGFIYRYDPDPDDTRSQFYALRILMAKKSGPARFGYSDETVTLGEARRALATAATILSRLSGAHRAQLANKISATVRLLQVEAPTEMQNFLGRAMFQAGERRAMGCSPEYVTAHEVGISVEGRQKLNDEEARLASELLTGSNGVQTLERLLVEATAVLQNMEIEHRDVQPANKKRNWMAAAIAGECRLVWAQENREIESPEWLAHLRRKGSHDNSKQHIFDFAPSQHQDTPGPFGRFLNDVLAELNILNRAGEAVSGAVALRSWANANQQSTSRNKQETSK